MEEQAIKIRRSNILIKCCMALAVLFLAVQYFQSQVLDLGAVSTTLAVLCLFRGLLLSPVMLSAPIRKWFREDVGVKNQSKKYFLLAAIFGMIGAI